MQLPLSPQNRKRLDRFKRIRRGWYSLWILLTAFILSLGAELFIGNRPIVLRHDGSVDFPALTDRYYSATGFGDSLDTEVDFREVCASARFQASGGWCLMPPHPYSPLESIRIKGDRPPSRPQANHPCGTDNRGRDVLARLIYGFRVSLSFALALVTASVFLGIVIGAVQGFWGGWVDLLFQRIIEIWQVMPFLYVVLMVSSIMTPSFLMLVGILMLFMWIPVSRYVRAEVLRERSRDYVTAARALGGSSFRQMFTHILPNSLTPVITMVPFRLVAAIFTLTSLDFLGYGLPAPTPSWGELFKQGRSNLPSYWLTLWPFLALFSTLLLATFVGEAAREAWDPKHYHAPVEDDE